MSQQNQRAYPRIPRELSVTVSKLEYPLTEGTEHAVVSKDLAGGGISLVSTEAYEPGTKLSLKIDLQGWQRYMNNVRSIVDEDAATAPLTAIAEVAWSEKSSEGYMMGIKFVDIYEDEYNALKTFLSKLQHTP